NSRWSFPLPRFYTSGFQRAGCEGAIPLKALGRFFQKARDRAASGAPGVTLRQEFLDCLAADIRQAEVSALEFVGQLGMIEAQQGEYRRLDIVDVDLVSGRRKA